MFTDALANLGAFYLNGADPRDPRASPLFGDLDGLPPMLFHVGESELLRDDSVRFAKRRAGRGLAGGVEGVGRRAARAGNSCTASCRRRAARSTRPPRSCARRSRRAAMSEVLDVLIVGAGLSGVGMACHLQRARPWARYAILEARGGHRRHLGFVPLSRRALRFRHVHAGLRVPAVGRSRRRSPTGPSILGYVQRNRRRARRRQDRFVFDTKVVSAVLGFARGAWTVEAERDGERRARTPRAS